LKWSFRFRGEKHTFSFRRGNLYYHGEDDRFMFCCKYCGRVPLLGGFVKPKTGEFICKGCWKDHEEKGFINFGMVFAGGKGCKKRN